MKSQFFQCILFLPYLFAVLLGLAEPVESAVLKVNVDKVSFVAQRRPLINVFISAINRKTGSAVKDLDADNFIIKEDGVTYSNPSEVKYFVVTDRKLIYMVVLETREKLSTSLTLVCQGLKTFVREMGFRYPGAVLTYTGRPIILARPTQDINLLEEKIGALHPVKGSSRLFDGLLFAVNELNKYAESSELKTDRRSLILLTDGLDQGSMFSLAACKAKIMQNNISLFVVGYGRKENQTLQELAQLAEKSGGGFYFAYSPDMISPLLLTVADRLKYQYILTCQPKNITPDGKRHEIRVNIKKSGYTGQGSLAFIAPKIENKKFVCFTAVIVLGATFLVILMLLVKNKIKPN